MKKVFIFLLLIISFSFYGQKKVKTVAEMIAEHYILPKKKVKELEQKVLQNDPKALLGLGKHYQYLGIQSGAKYIFSDKNLKKSKKYFEDAVHITGSEYRGSIGGSVRRGEKLPDRNKLREMYSRALYELGDLYYEMKKYSFAKKYFKQSMEQEYSSAFFTMGLMHEKGQGVSVDYHEAIWLYKRPYKFGDKDDKKRASGEIGNVYFKYLKDYKNAVLWYEKSVELGMNYSYVLKNFEKAKSLLNEETNAVNESPIIKSKREFYKTVIDKTEKALVSLTEGFLPVKKRKADYDNLVNERKSVLISTKQQNASLNKRKSEFETQEEYESRKKKYNDLVTNSTKEVDSKIAELLKRYESVVTRRYTTADALNKDYFFHMKKITKQKNMVSLAKNLSPEVMLYKAGSISSMNYLAEKGMFEIVMNFRFINSRQRRDEKKTYYVKVPRDQAQKFKQNKESFKYYYFLKDLQAIITQNKTYALEPIHTWYTRLSCDKKEEKAVLLINNSPDTRDVKTYLKKTIINDATFKKAAKELYNSYLGDYTKNVKAAIAIRFDKKGSCKGFDLEYKQGDNYAPINSSRSGSDNQSREKGDFSNSIEEVVKSFKIQSPTKQCEPQEFTVYFDYLLTGK